MIDRPVKTDQVRIERQHQRCLEHAAVFEIPACEAVGIEFRDRRLVYEIPIGQDDDLHVFDAVPSEFAERQIDPFDDKPRILEVNVRSEEHTSELQSLMRISHAVLCLQKKTVNN